MKNALFIFCLTLVFNFSLSAQKRVQNMHLYCDMGLNYTGGFNFSTSKTLIPKVGYTANVYHEHQFNGGNTIRVGIGHSLNGFAFDNRFTNVLHLFNLNTPLLYGKKLKNRQKIYIGVIPSYAFKIFYTELLNSYSPSKFDAKLNLTYSKAINPMVGYELTGQIGTINVGVFEGGHMMNWTLSSKLYLKFLTNKSEAFFPSDD